MSTSHNLAQKLGHELKSVVLVTAFFLVWLGTLMGLKALVLAEYHVRVREFSLALLGALVLAKVVLILEPVPLGSWLTRRPAWVELLFRAALYALGAFVVMVLEKAFEARHEYGGFRSALSSIIHHRDMPHIWANTICVTGALLAYNFLVLLRRHLGPAGVRRVLLSPPPNRASGGHFVRPPTTRMR